MRQHILFIDTETTGIPLNWAAPYSDERSWPYSVQIAWSIYTKDGEELKSENHYIYEPQVAISAASENIHGLTKAFLQANGKNRKQVLSLLAQDLDKYQPLVVGHFMQLDYHMLGVGFHRSNLPNPLLGLPLFCTMDASANFYLPPRKRFLHLGELYQRLFRKPLERQHDAAVDAKATAACFFKLLEQGDITEAGIAKQKPVQRLRQSRTKVVAIWLALLAGVILILLWIYMQ